MKNKAKEDPSYIPKLERAIARKYGKETVDHPLKEWDDEKEKDDDEKEKDDDEKEEDAA